jgi:hypothetical protein
MSTYSKEKSFETIGIWDFPQAQAIIVQYLLIEMIHAYLIGSCMQASTFPESWEARKA